MPAEKFIEWDPTNGRYRQNEGLQASAGAGDAGKIPALDAGGKLDNSMMPVGIGAASFTATASEALSAGDFVNEWDNAGVKSVRKADANANRKADGFVTAAVLITAIATVFYGDVNNALTGLTPGAEYWLSEAAGAVVTPAPTTAGSIVQRLGKALSATELIVDIQEVPLELA